MRAAIINVNLIIQRQVQKMAGELPDTIIAAITTMLRDWQAALSNSLPSLTGIQ
jgi:capsid protein